MSEYLPKEVREALELARRANLRRRSRLCVHAGDTVFPILRLWHDGFSIDADQLTHLRGLVDIYDGPRHLWQCLIVASESVDGVLNCDFKRATAAHDHAPLDFYREDPRPAGLLTRR